VTRLIGIDLGTTNTCVAAVDRGRPVIVASRQGERIMPSVVSYPEKGATIVGSPAKRQTITQPKRTVSGVKRLIGRAISDPEVRRLAETLPYEVAAGPTGDAWVRIDDRLISPEEISAQILRVMGEVAGQHHGGDAIAGAVITVPAYFDHAQRQATKDAAEIAGLPVARLINEPTAAALGFGAHRQPSARFAVCDLGGGTFDVSIVNVQDGVFEVVATQGDGLLGGGDFDRRMVHRLAAEIRAAHGVDPMEDPQLLGRLHEECAEVKHALSASAQATLQLPYVKGGAGFIRPIKRLELESWTQDLVVRLESPCQQAMATAGLRPTEIDQVILVGGATRMPAVQRKLEQIFNRPPARVVNPDEIVAIGAATQAAILGGELDGIVLLDVTSQTLGFDDGTGRMMPVIPKSSTVPTRESRIVPTRKDGEREVRVEVYEGDAPMARDNRHLGAFVLSGLPEARAGDVLVMVDFSVDVDGIVRVSGRELTSRISADVRLYAGCGLTRADVRRLATQAGRE
jgi:molecular chaperone DnaK